MLVVAWCAVALMALETAAQGFPQRKTPARPPAGKGKTTTKGTARPVDVPLDISPDKLPEGYEPPPDTPELMTLDEPLITADEAEEIRKKVLGDYRRRLRNGGMSREDKEIIEKGLRYRLYIMTLKENERELHKKREDLTAQDLRTAGSIGLKPQDAVAFRRYVLQEIVKLTEPMLQNNLYVRLQAATLLGELELVMADPTKNVRLETFTPACEPLIKVLEDPAQPLPVKIAAARSMVRLCKYAGTNLPPVEMRHRIAKAALSELAKADTHYWYQMRLIDVLATLDVTLDLDPQSRKPFIVIGLLNVLNDPQRDWHARAEAAWALGRVPFDPAQVDHAAVIRDIMQLLHDMAKAAQQTPNDPKWRTCLFKVYLAFQPLNAEDREATRRARAGLLNSPLTAAASMAQQAYPLVHPIVNSVLNDKPITAQMIQAVDTWLQKNNGKAAQANVNNNAAARQSP